MTALELRLIAYALAALALIAGVSRVTYGITANHYEAVIAKDHAANDAAVQAISARSLPNSSGARPRRIVPMRTTRPGQRLTLLLALLSLTACATSKPRYASGPCPEPWTIPAEHREPPQAPAAIAAWLQASTDLTRRLTGSSPPASTTQASSPGSSTQLHP